MSTSIEWCRNPDGSPGETWNPIAMRCTPVSEGCANCWHLRFVKRHAANKQFCPEHRAASAGGVPWLNPVALKKPFSWKKPKMVAVQLMGDIFHDSVQGLEIDRVMNVILRCPQHTFIILTKRVKRMERYFFSFYAITRPPISDTTICPKPIPNLWLGVSAENQANWNKRLPVLLSIPAAKHFVSVEPMLGPITPVWEEGNWVINPFFGTKSMPDCDSTDADKWGQLNWVVCGAEQGPGARKMDMVWANTLRADCREYKTPFFFKKSSKGVCAGGVDEAGKKEV